MKRGVFVTLEGCEGAGKTVNMQFIREYLSEHDIDVVSTREPGGTPMAEEIRKLLITPNEESISAETELLLMFAARAQHLHQCILPALAQQKWVVSDRFTDATYAYQGGGRGMSEIMIARLEYIVQKDFRPDRVIVLDVPVEVGLDRAAKRGELDRFESEKRGFFERVRATYLARAYANQSRYRVVDATKAISHVQDDLAAILDEVLREQGRKK